MRNNIDECLLDEIVNRLDNEINIGAVRVSVEHDEELNDTTNVSHNVCRAYGKKASETVGLLDMYTDHCSDERDR